MSNFTFTSQKAFQVAKSTQNLAETAASAINGVMPPTPPATIRFIDLFCGIGGFRLAFEGAARRLGFQSACVFSSDIDEDCQKAYQANFGEKPRGDITKIETGAIPAHDVLLAGFPCQPFSIIGHRKGFEDARGTLFFEIAKILETKRPSAFVLENVKLLNGHDGGRTLARILEVLRSLGYHVHSKVLNALDFGLPQKRERIFIAGFRHSCDFTWPTGGIPMRSLKEILEKKVPEEFYASEYIKKRRLQHMQPTKQPTIWHENKAGHISAYPYSCALRAGASYNYLLVNGERRLTPREMLRLQGFPDAYKIVCNYTQTRKQAGNSLPVSVAAEVMHRVLLACAFGQGAHAGNLAYAQAVDRQLILLDKQGRYGHSPKIKNGRKIPSALSA